MTPADHYRVRAAEFSALARTEMNPDLHLEYAKMAQAYLRLATLAERNSHTDVVYETPALSPGPRGDADPA
jgi:hypothetical protein